MNAADFVFPFWLLLGLALSAFALLGFTQMLASWKRRRQFTRKEYYCPLCQLKFTYDSKEKVAPKFAPCPLCRNKALLK